MIRTSSGLTPPHSIFTWCTGSYPVDSEVCAWPGTHSEVSGRGQSCEGTKGSCYISTGNRLGLKWWPKWSKSAQCWWGGSALLRAPDTHMWRRPGRWDFHGCVHWRWAERCRCIVYQVSGQEYKFFLSQRSSLWDFLLTGWGAQTAGQKDTNIYV